MACESSIKPLYIHPITTPESADTDLLQTIEAHWLPVPSVKSIYHPHDFSSIQASVSSTGILTYVNIVTGHCQSFIITEKSIHYDTISLNTSAIQWMKFQFINNYPEHLLILPCDSQYIYHTTIQFINPDTLQHTSPSSKEATTQPHTHIHPLTNRLRIVASIDPPLNRVFTCFDIGYSTDQIACGDNGGNITLWDIYQLSPLSNKLPTPLLLIKNAHTRRGTNESNDSVSLQDDDNSITSMCLLDGAIVSASASDFTVKLWNIADHTLLHTFENIETPRITCITALTAPHLPLLVNDTPSTTIQPLCSIVDDTWESEELLAVGTQQGDVYLLSLTQLRLHDLIASPIDADVSYIAATHTPYSGILAVAYIDGHVNLYQTTSTIGVTKLIGSHYVADEEKTETSEAEPQQSTPTKAKKPSLLNGIVSCEYNSHPSRLDDFCLWVYNGQSHLFLADPEDATADIQVKQADKRTIPASGAVSHADSRTLDYTPIKRTQAIRAHQHDASIETGNNESLLVSPPRPLTAVPQPHDGKDISLLLSTPQPHALNTPIRATLHSRESLHNHHAHTQSHVNHTNPAVQPKYPDAKQPLPKPSSTSQMDVKMKQALRNPKRIEALLQSNLHEAKSLIVNNSVSVMHLEQRIAELQMQEFDPTKLTVIKQKAKASKDGTDKSKILNKVLNVPFKQQIYSNLPPIDPPGSSVDDSKKDKQPSASRRYVKCRGGGRSSDKGTHTSNTDTTTQPPADIPQLMDTFDSSERELQHGDFHVHESFTSGQRRGSTSHGVMSDDAWRLFDFPTAAEYSFQHDEASMRGVSLAEQSDSS